MVAFGHTSIGVLIGVAVLSVMPDSVPLWIVGGVGLIAGVVSHYITDRIPHGHYHFDPAHLSGRMVAIFCVDFFGGIGVLSAIALYKFGFGKEIVVLAVSIIGAQLPDVFEGLVSVGIIPRSGWIDKHRHFHFILMHSKTPKNLRMGGLKTDGAHDETRIWSWSDAWQVLCFFAAIWSLLLLR